MSTPTLHTVLSARTEAAKADAEARGREYYGRSDAVTVTVHERPDGAYIIGATSAYTGESWAVVARSMAHAGEAVAACNVGEVLGAYDWNTGPWVIGAVGSYGHRTPAEAVQNLSDRFDAAERAWGDYVRSEPDTEARWVAADALQAALDG